MDKASGPRAGRSLIVPLPAGARVLTRWPLPVVVEPGVWMILGLAVALGIAFALLNSITLGHDHPSVSEVVTGVAIAMLWPVVLLLHELGHAVAGSVVRRPPVWLRLGLVPAVVLTPPPVERWSRILVSASGPMVEISAGLLCIAISPGVGALQFFTEPLAMVGGVCVLNGAANLLLPWPPATDGGKLWRAVWNMTTGQARN